MVAITNALADPFILVVLAFVVAYAALDFSARKMMRKLNPGVLDAFNDAPRDFGSVYFPWAYLVGDRFNSLSSDIRFRVWLLRILAAAGLIFLLAMQGRSAFAAFSRLLA